MTFWEVLLLVGGGLAAGVINTMAGGGSALTVPLLVLAGVPGNQANGSNRVGVLAASGAAVAAFRQEGIDGLKGSRAILVPTVVGSLVGSFGISQVADETFETIFGYLLIPIIFLTIFKPKPAVGAVPWSTG
ncbi:sulfite exporter TauE/SafE family protein, partial [Ilumatobacter sp.]|uniref:sulfite exporter TauE/SafE family protein n=1 Tax=Ilumatobacter sp. TaxID=1967498 RepID=UPI003C614B43